MKKIVIIVIFLLVISGICMAQVNGVREDLAEGRMKVRCWGTHAERGYAQGYLLAEESVQLFEDYVLGYMFSNNAVLYEQSRTIFIANWEVDEEYLEEFGAALEGITAAGESIYFVTLGREIDEYDIAMVNAVVDILAFTRQSGLRLPDPFGCSTLTSWGEATADDPLLQGDLIVTRHLDWNGAGMLDNYPLMLVCMPEEADEQAFITFTYPLFVTGLSATNESGLTCFMNVGSNNTIINGGPYKPVLLTMRKAIEKIDFDGSGVCDTQDMVAALSGSNTVAAAIITCVKDSETLPVIIEQNNVGTAVRTQADNTLAPAIIGDNLVATNHFRVLYPPQYCNRYSALAYQIEGDSDFSAERQWQVLSDAGGQGTWTRMTIQINSTKGECLWTSTAGNTPSYETSATQIDLKAEMQGWVNKPYYAPRTVPVFLFVEDGLSGNDPEILAEFNGYNTGMGVNSCWDLAFLSAPDLIIDEYPEMTERYLIEELPAVVIRGQIAHLYGGDNYSRLLLNQLLPSSPVELEIVQLDIENNIVYFTIKNLIGVSAEEYHLVYSIWEEDQLPAINKLALNWHWEAEELEFPVAGEKELYELELSVPPGDWTNRRLGLWIEKESSHRILQADCTEVDGRNPVQVSFNGSRQLEIAIEATSCIIDTITIFNTSEAECTCGIEYDLTGLQEEISVMAEIIRADGEEEYISAEEIQEYTLLPGEYLYLVTELTRLIEYESYWEFTLEIISEAGSYQLEMPFIITRQTDADEEEIPAVLNRVLNYPNPFNPSTRIVYEIAKGEICDLVIYNIRGEELQREKGLRESGSYIWDASKYGSGVYLYELQGRGSSVRGKMVLVK